MKQCRDCGKPFEPAQEYFYLCPDCYAAGMERECQQTTLSGKQCQRKVTRAGKFRYCTQHYNENRKHNIYEPYVETTRKQCKAISDVTGQRCRALTENENEYCSHHTPIALPAESWLKQLVEGGRHG